MKGYDEELEEDMQMERLERQDRSIAVMAILMVAGVVGSFWFAMGVGLGWFIWGR